MTVLVSHGEANVLRIARAAMGLESDASWRRLVHSQAPVPQTFSSDSLRLLEDTLSRGLVRLLARSGAWVTGAGGRVWETDALPSLHFSGAVVELLRTIVATPGNKPLLGSQLGPFTPADELVLVFLIDQLSSHDQDAWLLSLPEIQRQPLVQLAFADRLAVLGHIAEINPVRLEDDLVFVLSLRSLLAHAWLRAELLKTSIPDPVQVARVGNAQHHVLEGLFERAKTVSQQRALGFLIDAAMMWLRQSPNASVYAASLTPAATIRDRMEAVRTSGAFLRGVLELRKLHEAHRSVRFFEDDYRIAQSLVRDWGRFQDGFDVAERLEASLRAIPTGGSELSS